MRCVNLQGTYVTKADLIDSISINKISIFFIYPFIRLSFSTGVCLSIQLKIL